MVTRKIVAVAVCLAAGTGLASTQEVRFFRIGAGNIGGTYFATGNLIASVISNPPGSRDCAADDSCGVPGLVAVVQSANGSVATIDAIRSGALESGIAQSNFAYWAATGTEPYAGEGEMNSLRIIANLYPESIHLVARKGAGIKSVRALKGKRVSLGELGSGTPIDARIVLRAYGLGEDDIEPEYLEPGPAIALMEKDRLDAFFFMAAVPADAMEKLASGLGAEIVPIEGPEAEAILAENRTFEESVIPAGTYDGIGAIKTVGVSAQWVVDARVDEELVYRITKLFWEARWHVIRDNGPTRDMTIALETALEGVRIPLHPGAARYYREVGLLK